MCIRDRVLEVHLGYAAKALGWKIMTPVFDGAHEQDIFQGLKDAGYSAVSYTHLDVYKRQLYLVREAEIKHWRDYNKLNFIQCALSLIHI